MTIGLTSARESSPSAAARQDLGPRGMGELVTDYPGSVGADVHPLLDPPQTRQLAARLDLGREHVLGERLLVRCRRARPCAPTGATGATRGTAGGVSSGTLHRTAPRHAGGRLPVVSSGTVPATVSGTATGAGGAAAATVSAVSPALGRSRAARSIRSRISDATMNAMAGHALTNAPTMPNCAPGRDVRRQRGQDAEDQPGRDRRDAPPVPVPRSGTQATPRRLARQR